MSLRIENPPITLRKLCLKKIRDAIKTGYFPAGKRLIERNLCEELGVSRSVVREVIRQLEVEGLIEVLPKKGPIVSFLNWDVACQIYDIKLLLEQNAVVACILNIGQEKNIEFDKLSYTINNLSYLDEIDLIIYTSNKLYEIIFFTAGHHLAWQLLQNLNARIGYLNITIINLARYRRLYFRFIKNVYEAIYIYKDINKAKCEIEKNINEAKIISNNILNASHKLN
ncbi:GntR family transcriptional regulator [Acinetobacter pittii]|uniref:GntR family transcriptional regulator n=1 Tax=Acinetobacter pittii TaxID=48296 RepID=UPI003AA9A0F8